MTNFSLLYVLWSVARHPLSDDVKLMTFGRGIVVIFSNFNSCLTHSAKLEWLMKSEDGAPESMKTFCFTKAVLRNYRKSTKLGIGHVQCT